MGTYRISQLADRAGMPATTLRYYEKVGLLPSQRTAVELDAHAPDGADALVTALFGEQAATC